MRAAAKSPDWRKRLRGYVQRRAEGEPLQYILRTQPFGELEILCQAGVLIPRPETEGWVSRLGALVTEFMANLGGGHVVGGGVGAGLGRTTGARLRGLDLCTGTGCVALSLYQHLCNWDGGKGGGGRGRYEFEVCGVDISPTALHLARENLGHNIALGNLTGEAAGHVRFLRADVLVHSLSQVGGESHPNAGAAAAAAPYIIDAIKEVLDVEKPGFDILTANPPYISPAQFLSGVTTRSVRRYEPRIALVPGSFIGIPEGGDTAGELRRGDEFYHHILPLSRDLNAGLTVLEVGDTAQGGRVVELAKLVLGIQRDGGGELSKEGWLLEIWFDDGRVQVWGLDGDEIEMKGESDGESSAVGSSDGGGGEDSGDGSGGGAPAEEVSARVVVIWRREWAVWRRRRLREMEICS